MFNSYMDERGFKSDLKRQLRDYFIHSEGLFREQHYKELLHNLSPQLQEKLALVNVGPWIKSVPVVRYAMLQATGLFETARVAVETQDPDDPDGELIFRGAAMGPCSSALAAASVVYEDGRVERDVDVSRLHVPASSRPSGTHAISLDKTTPRRPTTRRGLRPPPRARSRSETAPVVRRDKSRRKRTSSLRESSVARAGTCRSAGRSTRRSARSTRSSAICRAR